MGFHQDLRFSLEIDGQTDTPTKVLLQNSCVDVSTLMILYFILFAVERAELGEEVVWATGSQVSPASVLESKFRRI